MVCIASSFGADISQGEKAGGLREAGIPGQDHGEERRGNKVRGRGLRSSDGLGCLAVLPQEKAGGEKTQFCGGF